ncbi:MAG: DUF2066 domain-containing protein [Gammaproteobacteria bacterium]
MFHILNFKTKIRIFVALLFVLLFVFKPAIAGHATELYKVDILVVDESASVRQAAFKQGLDEVFIRLSGDSIIMDKLKRPAAATYVKQYSYDPLEKPATNKQGEQLTYRLKMQYNGSLVEKYLQQNGFPVWGEHRPEVVVWLAIRDGRNEYVLRQSDQSLLKVAADDALLRRGVPVHWPLFDNKDKKILSIADIRGGFKDPVSLASKRYSSGPALAGSLIWNGSQWQSSWSLLMQGNNRHWSLVGANYNVLINKAIDQAADALGIVFAIHGSAGKQQLKTIQVNIQAVDSITKYRRIEHYLRGLNAVASVRPLQVDEHSVVFEVALRSQENDFLSLIKNDAELLKVEPPKVEPEEVEPQEIEPEEVKIDKIPGHESSLDLQESTAETETLNAEPVTERPEPITVYYYRLLK